MITNSNQTKFIVFKIAKWTFFSLVLIVIVSYFLNFEIKSHCGFHRLNISEIEKVIIFKFDRESDRTDSMLLIQERFHDRLATGAIGVRRFLFVPDHARE